MSDFNLYPDAGIESIDYSGFGSAITKSGQDINFNGAASTDAFGQTSPSDLLEQVKDYFAKGGQYRVSIYVANYVSGGTKAKIRNGTSVSLNVAGDGWTTPVLVIAGTATNGLVFSGLSAGTFDIVPDSNNEAIRVTT